MCTCILFMNCSMFLCMGIYIGYIYVTWWVCQWHITMWLCTSDYHTHIYLVDLGLTLRRICVLVINRNILFIFLNNYFLNQLNWCNNYLLRIYDFLVNIFDMFILISWSKGLQQGPFNYIFTVITVIWKAMSLNDSLCPSDNQTNNLVIKT